jgi:hypothetical protein
VFRARRFRRFERLLAPGDPLADSRGNDWNQLVGKSTCSQLLIV